MLKNEKICLFLTSLWINLELCHFNFVQKFYELDIYYYIKKTCRIQSARQN